jgi:hypothetical protein
VALGALGVALVVVGVIVAVAGSEPLGISLVVIGLVAFVLAASDWAEFSAEIRNLVGVKVTRASAVPPTAPAHEPELKILSLEERGGGTGAIDFGASVVNEGRRFCRAEIVATVDGHTVECQPPVLDLPPNEEPKTVRVLVPRPRLGELIKAFNSSATLYGRTLTLRAGSGDHQVERQWSEHVYGPDENRERHQIQQREWRIGRGEALREDLEADAQAELLRRHEERLDK